MATAKLREYLAGRFAAVGATAYHWPAPATADFLYLVYTLKEVSYEEGFSLQELEVDVVDYGTDTAPAEAMADKLQASLDHLYALTDDFQVAIYRERRQTIEENDKSIIRRRLTFQVRLHERSSL